MRITTFFMMAFCVHVSATGLSQTITLKGDKLSLKDVFTAIERQTDYVVLFTEESLKAEREVHIEAQDMPLLQFLEAVLPGQALGYEIRNRTIVVVPEDSAGRQPAQRAMESNEVQKRQQPYTGTIADASGKPLTGATIAVKGTRRNTVSDDRGRFRIAAETGETLVISSVGFTSREINVGAATQLGVISLEASTSDLDEVNVVAYGTTTKRESTGSVSTIKGKDLEGIPASNFANLLQGRVAGMDVTNMSGSPGGGGIAITIRGYNSLDVEQGRRFSNPLWVVDGVPLSSFTSPVTGTNMLADINPDMIESIQILKDASSASIYGSRAANGVIIVTTKKGKHNQKAQFSANVSQTYSVLPQLPTVTIGRAERDFRLNTIKNAAKAYLDPETMRYKYPESFLENYLHPTSRIDYFLSPNPTLSEEAMQEQAWALVFQDSLNSFYNNATNFFPLYYETGKVTNANIQTYGGADKISYGIGLGYYDERGILKGTGFNRIDLNSNLNVTPADKIHVDLRFNASLIERKRGEQSENESFGISPAIETVPGDPYELSSLYPGEGSEVWENVIQNFSGSDEKNSSVRLRSNFKLMYEIHKDWEISSSLAADYAVHRRNYFQPSYLSYSGFSKSVGETGVNLMVLNENLLSYKKSFNDRHNFSAVAGFSYQYDQVEYNGGSGENSPSDKIYYVTPFFPKIGERDFGDYSETIAFQNYRSDMQEKALLSYFTRVEYNYQRKYLLSASFRRDGSSVFGENNKWGTFPSIAGGWTFSEESWVKNNFKWLSFAKLRSSWGKSGMHFSQNYLALGIMDVGRPFQGNGTLEPDYGYGLYNENLSWEETDQYDIGIDLDLFDHRLSITSDYYYRYTDKMLMPIRLPGVYYGYRNQWRNAAAVSNEGIELLVNYELIIKPDFYWKISVNGARNWNLFNKSYDEKDVIDLNSKPQWIIGKALNGIYTLKTDSYVDYQDELPVYFNAAGISNYLSFDTYGKQFYYKPGDYKFVDVNADGSITYKDMVYAGSALPVISGGLGSEFRWKKLEINFLMSFQLGKHIINAMPVNSIAAHPFPSSQLAPILLDIGKVSFWQAPGDNAADYSPMQYNFETGLYDVAVDRNVEKVNWLKLKSFNINYDISNAWIKPVGIESVRVFLSGENLFSFTNYSGIDPEIVAINSGIDRGMNYPLARKFTFGLTLKF